ncbi:transposable element Tcb1 transposase [Trichonephila clavipes]|nr:transposable element Tcb1 transposase [Trichonephila clavipes]
MLNSCVMNHHNGPAPVIMVWGAIDITLALLYYALPGLATAIFQQDNARPHVARIAQRSSSITRLNCFSAGSLFGSFADGKHVVHSCSTIDTDYTLQLPHQINFGNVWKLLGLLYPKNTSKVSLNQCRGVWQW